MAYGPTNLGRGGLALQISPAKARRIHRRFRPYVMPGPPSGSFDPSLDAARDAASRGYGDLQQDAGLADTRASVDYGTAIADLERTKARGLEDFNTNTGLLRRSFSQLANRQQESGNQSGVISGGAFLQAAAKRAANQQVQQTGLDTEWRRQQQEIQSETERVGLGYERGLADRSTALTRAGREDRRFGIDTESQKSFQASQSGYVPPGRGEPGGMPRNEHRDATGPYRVQTIGGRKGKVRPDGSVEWLEPRRRGGRGRRIGPNTAAGTGWI